MRRRLNSIAFLSALTLSAAGLSATGSQAQIRADSYVNHHIYITEDWVDTPYRVGLLEMAKMEAETVAEQAALAVERPDNLSNIRLRASYILHALDPERQVLGPGEEYGLIKAAKGVAIHAHAAMRTQDTNDRVQRAARAVRISALNVVDWAERIAALTHRIDAAGDAAEAFRAAQEVERLSNAILAGDDADGNGRITPTPGEGGLAQAEEWAERMR